MEHSEMEIDMYFRIGENAFLLKRVEKMFYVAGCHFSNILYVRFLDRVNNFKTNAFLLVSLLIFYAYFKNQINNI